MLASESVWEGLCVQGGVKGRATHSGHRYLQPQEKVCRTKVTYCGQAWRHGPLVRGHSEDILVTADRCADTAWFSLLT